MKTSNKIITDIELCRSEIENKIQDFQRIILEQKHKIEDLENEKETELDSIFKDLLSVIDAFDKADRRLAEQYSENEDIQKARRRFATQKKKFLKFWIKIMLNKIYFPDGLETFKDCQVKIIEQLPFPLPC